MGSLEYARIVEAQTGCPARLLVAEDHGVAVAYPFLLRSVGALPFAGVPWAARWDTFTPEYTGPIQPGPARGPPGAWFAELFGRHCREQGIVAEFAHLNPWHASTELLDARFLECSREVVYIDLAGGADRVWSASLSSDARRMTRRARESGMQIRRAESEADVEAFHRLYLKTMERRAAEPRYIFPPAHFLAFFRSMPSSSFLVLAEHQGRLAAGGLFLHGGADVYWHLSAADLELAHLRAVNGYLWEVIAWAAAQGKERMLLGGGYRPGDGVFRFKASYSPLRARFQTYRRIHDREAYAGIAAAWSACHDGRQVPSDYFPGYRAE